MDDKTYGALKRIIFTLHETPVKGINGNDFVMIRDWIDETAKEHFEHDSNDWENEKEVYAMPTYEQHD